ncbi:MAG: hypothetical protein CMF61_06545 [Magnetococcales bacterium]|nr:hypothetical protein [Magnetococcales bacterium]PPR14849.1 MAG: hypothetical protein CFH43_01040 [Pseudomonadota bacterium]
MAILYGLFMKMFAAGGGALTGFSAFLMSKVGLLATLLKPVQAVIYVWSQALFKNFMRKKKMIEQEVYDAELDVEDLNIKKKTVDVYRTKNGMVTQRMKKIRKLNQDIIALWRWCKRYDVAIGGKQGVKLMQDVEVSRRRMDEAMSKFPELQKEMRVLDAHYDKEELEIEDRLEEKLMLRVNKWASVGKWLRVSLYVGGWFFVIFKSFDWLYSCFASGSNLYDYMVTYAQDLYPGYVDHVNYYHATFHEPLKWFLFVVGGGLLFWKRLFMGRAVYVEFTRRMFLVLRGMAILVLGVAFVTLSMQFIHPLIQEGGFIYEVFLKDYPEVASVLSNVVFGLLVLVGWGYLTYKSAKKLFYDPRRIVVPSEHNEKAEEFYENQKEICHQYTICAQCYYMLIIYIEYTRDQKEAVFEGFEDYDTLMAKSKNEDKFFAQIATEEVLEELDEVLPSRYAYRTKKLTVQQDV